MKHKNKLIVFEGIDGVGKTTVATAIKKLLRKRGIPAILYESYEKKYPYFNKLKSFIKTTPINASYLFYLSSSIYKSYIIKKLLKKTWIICDRYFYSTIARHMAEGSTVKIDMDSLQILKPDHAFLLTTQENIRRKRVKYKKHITTSDLVPKISGNFPYKMEKLLKKMDLTEIDNSGELDNAITKIEHLLFP